MIKRLRIDPRKRYGPRKGDLALAMLKGAGMGALIAMLFVKFLP